MSEMEDHLLLAEYARSQSESAFAALVARHVPLVYSAALRFTDNPHDAEEITQAVFIVLARKAGGLRPGTVLSGWLYQTARLTAANFRKGELRRHRREQEACMQAFQFTLNETNAAAWDQVAPHLDAAMGLLGETERNAVVLRFFENKTVREVGAALNLTEAAAHMRLSRALDKLRKIFAKRGVTLTAALIAGAISTNSVQAAPAGITASVISALTNGAMLSASTAGLAQATLKTITWAKHKFALGLITVAVVGVSALVMTLTARNTPNPLDARLTAANTSNPPALGLVASRPLATNAEAPTAEPREPFAATMKFNLYSPLGALAVRPDGRILLGSSVGGFFVDEQSGMLGVYCRGAMCLQPDGALDRSFFCDVGRPEVCDPARARLGVRPDGRVFVSGIFDTVDGKPRPSYTMLLADGRVDESFEPWRGSTNVPGRGWCSEGVYPATLLGDGSVAVTTKAFDGPATVCHLDASGRFIPPPTNVLVGEFSRPAGLILTLGPLGFGARKTIDWTRDTPAARRPPFQAQGPPSDLPGGRAVGDLPFERWTEPPSAVDAAKVLEGLFEETPLELCRYAVRAPEGGVILAVRDKFIGGSGPGRFMRFDQNWRPSLTFTNQYDANFHSRLTLKLQKDGKLLVAGLVGTLNGEPFRGLARLTENGALDRTFHCATGGTESDRVMDVALQEDGRIVICGWFSKVNGTECPHIARLNPDGSLDPTFQTPFLTLEQFNRDRFAKRRRVPVQQLSPSASANAAANATENASAASVMQTVSITSLGMEQNTAIVSFAGNPRQVYILQAREALKSGAWSNVATNQTGADGGGVFRDPDAGKHATRFYRVATP
jgi:RNA polymerase sigma factor (sigma-70 family)